MAALLTLLTDFGLQDIYVGSMKGVILQINSSLTVVDLTHQIPPQDITAASFALASAYPCFPDGSVHVVVVDPGVGSSRRAIAVRTAQGYLVGPDNGVFDGVLRRSPVSEAVELTEPRYWRAGTPSATFHGRDIFAPAGAHLASGVSLRELGQPVEPQTLVRLARPGCTELTCGLTGCIQYVDHFGNLITDIPGARIEGRSWSVEIAGRVAPGLRTYADASPGELLALVGSHGFVEIAVNRGNAHSLLKRGSGSRASITLSHPDVS
ncbi:MAG: SAM-dependent chlorinase/fluorinase [Gemmatimonadaceae bacterium]|nr:SAM-dependent chlorinase/fluorinase [Gloeobacterales cyanobacterium ES-bin-141]